MRFADDAIPTGDVTLPIPAESLSSPLVVYAGAIVFLIVLISMAAPRVFGPWSRIIHEWATQHRRMAEEREDALVADREEEITYLRRVAQARLLDIQERDRLAVLHSGWDREVMHQFPVTTPPPPLIPMGTTRNPDDVSASPVIEGEATP